MKIEQIPSPNFDGRKGEEITFLILHYTDTKTAEDAIAILTSEERQVSAHYTIAEDGTVYQHVEEKMRAWHVGVSSWQGKKNLNASSIGIEIVNPGHLWGYREFKDIQLKAVKELCVDILTRHESIKHVLAHSDVAPDRKKDPGELFPWAELAEHNIGIWPNTSDEDIVRGYTLNMTRALADFGYNAEDFPQESLIAFQRHYVPEVFEEGREGEATGLTRARLYALLTRYSDEALL